MLCFVRGGKYKLYSFASEFVLILVISCAIIYVYIMFYSGDSYLARSYNKLWKLMIDKNMNKTQLRVAANISTNAMSKIGRDESVPIETLEKICDILEFNNSTGENKND